MNKADFTKSLSDEGWKIDKYYDCEVWQKGHIILMIKDDDGDPYIEIFTGEKEYLSQIKEISFTPYRLLIRWTGDEEWFLRY